MNVKKPLLIAGAVAGLSFAGFGAAASAASASTADSPSNGLVDKIASTFNLDKDKVEAVFEQERSERETEREQRLETRLSQAVSDGELTEVQKSAILAKREELHRAMEAKRGEMQDKTATERKQAMQTEREALKTWAEQNDLSEEQLRYVMGGPGHGPGPRDDGPRTDDSEE